MKPYLWCAAALLALCVVDAAAAPVSRPAPKLKKSDLFATATPRLDQVPDKKLREQVRAFIRDMQMTLEFDANGDWVDPKGAATRVKTARDVFEIQIAPADRDGTVTLTKLYGGLQMKHEDAKTSNVLLVGLFNGDFSFATTPLDPTTARVVSWDEHKKKFREDVHKIPTPAMRPDLAGKTIWPTLPEKLVFDQDPGTSMTELVEARYDLAKSLLKQIKERQPEAKYTLFSRRYYGVLEGSGDMDKIDFHISEQNNQLKVVSISYKDGRRFDAQFDPIHIQEFVDGTSSVNISIKPDGRVLVMVHKN